MSDHSEIGTTEEAPLPKGFFRFLFSRDSVIIDGESRKRKVLEIQMLTDLVIVSANSSKSISDSLAILEVNKLLAAGEDSVVLHQRDIKSLVEAFESIVGSRPSGWFIFCSELLAQLENYSS